MTAAGAEGFHLLTDLALIPCVAAATTVIFQRIKQPVIPGYLLRLGDVLVLTGSAESVELAKDILSQVASETASAQPPSPPSALLPDAER